MVNRIAIRALKKCKLFLTNNKTNNKTAVSYIYLMWRVST